MATRLGIELSPVACRIVELAGRPLEPRRPLTTRVRSYAVLPPAGPETDSHFAPFRGRSAAVVIWGAGSEHRQVVVESGGYDRMRAEALESVGADALGMIADIAPASTAIKGASRQPVVLALASGAEVAAQLRPLVDARIRIHSVFAPADALLGLARARQAFAVAGGVEAYVALDESATCVALVRDGSLLFARELGWGYGEGTTVQPVPSRRDDLAARLVDELQECLAASGAGDDGLMQVSICGGLPELRTMTVPLMERLDVEVEALDSLFGVDGERLPEPAGEFRERTSELRLAWAAAADWNGPIDLYRNRRRRQRRAVLARAAVVAGVAAGLGAGWAIEQSHWWQTPPPNRMAARSAPARSAAAPPRAAPPAAPPVVPARPLAGPAQPATAKTMPAIPPQPAAAARPPASTTPPPQTTVTAGPPASTAPQIAAAKPAVPTPAPALSPPRAPSAPAPSRPPVHAPIVRTSPPIASSPVTRTSPPAAAALSPSAGSAPLAAPRSTAVAARRQPPAARRAASEPPPVPLDAALGTILYSPDRKLAIVDGRIVEIGDDVSGARIIDITPAMVLLRDGKGRLRSLTLASGAPASPPASSR